MSASDLGNNLGGEPSKALFTKPVVEPPKSKSKSKVAPPKKVETVRIQLEETDNMGPTGQFFGLNGAAYMLQPGRPAEVPVGIVNILNDAVMSVAIMGPDQQVLGYRDRLRFPYRFV